MSKFELFVHRLVAGLVLGAFVTLWCQRCNSAKAAALPKATEVSPAQP